MPSDTTRLPGGRLALAPTREDESDQVLLLLDAEAISIYDLTSQRSLPKHSQRPLVWDSDDMWFRNVPLHEMANVILSSRNISAHSPKDQIVGRIEWPLRSYSFELTNFDLGLSFNLMTTETAEYVRKRDIHESIMWLQSAAGRFFPGTNFEIDVLHAEDEEENMLAFRVYSSLGAADFRNQRHLVCEAMVEAGHKKLYELISIFQRRISKSGWQTFSWYSAISVD